MTDDIRTLIEVLRELKLKFRPDYNKEDILQAIQTRLLRKPDITDCSQKTIDILLQYGYNIVNENGIVLKYAEEKSKEFDE